MTQKEKWLPVRGFEGAYEVSNRGRVRSLTRQVLTSHGQVRTYKGRLKTPTLRNCGRLVVSLPVNNTARTHLVSVLVAEAFLGPRPENMLVCHNNGDPTDNRVENLRYDTYSENMHDKKKHGTDRNFNKTHCPRNHPLSGNNLVPSKLKRGARECLACARAQSRIWRHPELKDSRAELADSYFEKISQ